LQTDQVTAALEGRSIVLVGMMGAGKTAVGKRIAHRLRMPFVDADHEIEAGARLTIPEIFERFGEPYFRDGERKVIARLLEEGQKVLALGGGAFVNAQTRERIAAKGVSVWLKPEFEVLLKRVKKRSNRPLLQTPDPAGTLRRLLEERSPIYGLADITVQSPDGPHESVVDAIIEALRSRFISPAASSSTFETVRVALGDRAYDILIGDGLLERAGAEIARIAPHARAAIVTDENVAAIHLSTVEKSFAAAGLSSTSIVLPAGEATKSYAQFAHVCDALISAHIERRDVVVALGGGVVGDLAGFCASTLRRGVRFVQIPTTLLAQVDSSVGGKTAINSPLGKNLVGAFYQPSLVLADQGALDTLSLREFRAGYAEVVKYGLIDDRNFFEWLESNWRAVFAGGEARRRAVAVSCGSKARVVASDETEQGPRALLNLGHTFGHAFEALCHYDSAKLVHGEGVAVGMACAFRFSRDLGLCSGQDSARVEAHMRAAGLPTRIAEIAGMKPDPDALLVAMRQDKKVERGRLTFILARGIGETFIAKDVAESDVRAFLVRDLRN